MENESKDSGDTPGAREEPAAPEVPAPLVNVWSRIKEHKIAQWTLAYAAAAYAALDGTKIASDAFEWPHQVIRIAMVLLILGLPLVVTLAWYHGHRALRRVSGTEFTIIGVLLVMAAAVLWHFARAPQESVASKNATTAPTMAASLRPAVATPAKGSIAVLPFVDMSEKHDQEYFSDGLSEELIDHLAHIPELKVIARTSSFAFKGKNEDMRSIATKLGVANLLEGSVRKAGGELRITAQLIRASDGVHLWSQIYDRRLTDIFKIQDELSTTVANALNATLNVADAVGKTNLRGTGNVEAYNFLLQGNYFYARSGDGDLDRAIGFYHRALTLDPNYAIAWARVALVYSWDEGELGTAEAESKGRDAAHRALAIDPECAEAYFARGNLLRRIVGDWAAAKSDFEKAVALDPRSDAGEYAKGYILDLQGAMGGKFDEFINWALRRLERDPLDTDTMYELGGDQAFDGHLEQAVATFRRLLDLDPAYTTAWGQYGLTLVYMGRNVEALSVIQHETDSAFKLAMSAAIYWAMNRRPESDAALSALERDPSDQFLYTIAAVHAYRGESDAAFAWLDRAYRQRRGSLEYLKVEPVLRNLHGDPRFNALLRKVKLVE